MYYYLVQGNSVVGEGYEGMGVPVGMQLVASPLQLPPNKLYYDGSEIKPIPNKPDDNYIWVGTEWQPVQPRKTPKPPPVASNKLAVAVYDHVKQVDEVVADTLAYLFARLEGDVEEINLRYQKLSEQLTPKPQNLLAEDHEINNSDAQIKIRKA